jgi:hypothetical protein
VTAVDRFWSRVDRTDTCWIWRGGRKPKGYGNFWVDSQHSVAAHRFAYELLVGPIPPGLHLDHLCRVPWCVNPEHLEPVTVRENLLRGLTIPAANAGKTHCPQGHPYDDANTYRWGGSRHCRACVAARSAVRDRVRREAQRVANAP